MAMREACRELESYAGGRALTLGGRRPCLVLLQRTGAGGARAAVRTDAPDGRDGAQPHPGDGAPTIGCSRARTRCRREASGTSSRCRSSCRRASAATRCSWTSAWSRSRTSGPIWSRCRGSPRLVCRSWWPVGSATAACWACPRRRRTDDAPWCPVRPLGERLAEAELPGTVSATLAQRLYVCQERVPPVLLERMRRLAAFSNPKFLELQAMRMSTARTPRVIACFEQSGRFLVLPRGCREPLEELLAGLGVALELSDERTDGEPLEARFTGELIRPSRGRGAADARSRARRPVRAAGHRQDSDRRSADRGQGLLDARARPPQAAARAVGQALERVPRSRGRRDRDDRRRSRQAHGQGGRRDGPEPRSTARHSTSCWPATVTSSSTRATTSRPR